jgi:hypothetical protein
VLKLLQEIFKDNNNKKTIARKLVISYMENVRFTIPIHQLHNNRPTHWGPPSCEGLLCSCCDGVVQESNPFLYMASRKVLS